MHPGLLLPLVYLSHLPILLATPLPETSSPSLLTTLLDPLINDTITASTLNSPPPTLLTTEVHSADCLNINQGALMCCPSIFDGDQPIVVMAARMFDFELNGNSVNGFGCKSLDDGGFCPVEDHRLCCQITDLTVVPLISLAMWCHPAN